ncbi:acyltransferase family protein [Paenibacillus ferrarius]
MPTLDVLRALSIIPVVVLHTGGTAATYIGFLGSYGVLLFLCISGFLLSFLAFEEIKRNGHFK